MKLLSSLFCQHSSFLRSVINRLIYSNGTPLQCSCLENPMDRGAWRAAIHGVSEGQTRLNNFTFTFHFHALEKEMATHSSVLAWRIPGTGEPGGLPSMGSHRVRHNWSDLAAAAAEQLTLLLLSYTSQPPKLLENNFLLFNSLSLWQFIRSG